jgi:Rod binding domain-containing protein
MGSSPLNSVASASKHDQLVKQAQKWVAQTFYGTLLKQVRQSPFHSKLFDGGRGGQAWGSLYDQQLAEHMARGTGQKLVNDIVNRIEARQAYEKSSGKTAAKDSHLLRQAPQRSGHVPATLRA